MSMRSKYVIRMLPSGEYYVVNIETDRAMKSHYMDRRFTRFSSEQDAAKFRDELIASRT